MRFAFPKKKKKSVFPILPVLSVFAFFMFVASIFGEGGVLHALSLRIVKVEAEQVVEEQLRQNQQLKELLVNVRQHPDTAQKFLAEYGGLAPQEVTVYRFKSLADIESVSELEHIEGLDWKDRFQHRIRLLLE